MPSLDDSGQSLGREPCGTFFEIWGEKAGRGRGRGRDYRVRDGVGWMGVLLSLGI